MIEEQREGISVRNTRATKGSTRWILTADPITRSLAEPSGDVLRRIGQVAQFLHPTIGAGSDPTVLKTLQHDQRHEALRLPRLAVEHDLPQVTQIDQWWQDCSVVVILRN